MTPPGELLPAEIFRGGFSAPTVPREALEAGLRNELGNQLKIIHLMNGLMLKKEVSGLMIYCCPGAADIPYKYSITFDDIEVHVEDETSRFNMITKQQSNEILTETGRVLAVIQSAIMNIAHPEAQSRVVTSNGASYVEWELSLIKEGTLGINAEPELGILKITGIGQEGCLAKYSASIPGQIAVGDFIKTINGISPSVHAVSSIADGEIMNMRIQKEMWMRKRQNKEAQEIHVPAQEVMKMVHCSERK